MIPGKLIYFEPDEGGHFFGHWTADAGMDEAEGQRLSELVVFNYLGLSSQTVVVPKKNWRLPSDDEAHKLKQLTVE